MKKFLTTLLFSFAASSLLVSTASADVPPSHAHTVDYCARLVNLDAFPEIVLIADVTALLVDDHRAYQVKNNECLTKESKYNVVGLYWNTKNKANEIVQNNRLLENVPVGADYASGYVDEHDPLTRKEVDYSLSGVVGGKLVLFVSKISSFYNNGAPAKVETFISPLENSVETPTPHPLTATPVPVASSPTHTPVATAHITGTPATLTATPTTTQTSTISPSPTATISQTGTPTISTFSTNLTPQPTETLKPLPKIVQRGFFQSLWCFLGSLFGRGCQ